MRSADRLLPALPPPLRAALLAAAALALAGCASFGEVLPKRQAKAPAAPATATAPLPSGFRPVPQAETRAEPKPAARAETPAAAPAPAPEPPKVVETPVPAEAQRAFDAARAALAAGRKAEAERGLRALTQSHPELAGPHAALGLLLRDDGKLDEAIAAFERAVEVNPKRADLFNQLGVAYRMAGRFDRARAAYGRAIAADERYAPAQLNLGILLDIYLGEPAAALAQYEKYMALAGADDNVRKWIADLKNRVPGQSAVAQKEEARK